MNKTMKKYLSLLLAMMMLVSTFAVNASAACSHQISTGDPNYYEVVNPTCTEQGYTIYKCVYCGEIVSRGDYKDPLGHKFGEDKYESNGNGAYRKYNECEREYTQNGQVVTCNSKVVERLNGEEVVYYLVEFYNNKITASYDESIDYTKVADAFRTEKVYSAFVKEGDEAVYEGINLVREKTKEFPLYLHIGWSDKSNLEATRENNLSDADVLDLTSIKSNLTLYPVFEGLLANNNGTITHAVRFHLLNDDGSLIPGTFTQYVAHGAYPKYSDPNGVLYKTPEKKEDVVNTYSFNGWSTKINGKSGIPMDEIEKTPIYGDVGFYPTFTADPKEYTVEFYADGGKTLLQYKKGVEKFDAVFTGVNLETNLKLIEGVNLLNNDAASLEKESDNEYLYIWTGKWAVMGEDGSTGRTVDISKLEITGSEYKEIDGEKVIRLVPVYERRRQVYAVDIVMAIPSGEDADYYRGEADVHVVANNGQLVASGKTDADGKFRCYLYYQLPFTVTVATADEKYLGQAEIRFLQKGVDQDTEAYINRSLVQMELNPEYETHCQCIHHVAFIQPLWVRILNLLYSLFNVKYVCCYDMYSSIGPLLQYTP